MAAVTICSDFGDQENKAYNVLSSTLGAGDIAVYKIAPALMKLIFYEGREKVEKRKMGKKTSISDGNTKENKFLKGLV